MYDFCLFVIGNITKHTENQGDSQQGPNYETRNPERVKNERKGNMDNKTRLAKKITQKELAEMIGVLKKDKPVGNWCYLQALKPY